MPRALCHPSNLFTHVLVDLSVFLLSNAVNPGHLLVQTAEDQLERQVVSLWGGGNSGISAFASNHVFLVVSCLSVNCSSEPFWAYQLGISTLGSRSPFCHFLNRLAESENNGRPSAIFRTFQLYNQLNTCLAGHNGHPEALLAALLDRFICHTLVSLLKHV